MECVINSKEYDFLRNDCHLGDNIMLLTYGGSYAYGTNVEGSDIDIRGCTMERKEDLIGLGSFEQFEDRATDTVIYGFNKLVSLLMNCNPNVIEILGCKPEHYMFVNKYGRMLLDNQKIFLLKRAMCSFGGYATQQLRRLENALARDHYPPEAKEKHIMGSCNNAMHTFPSRYHTFSPEQIKLSIDSVDCVPQIFADVEMAHIPLREFIGIMNELTEISKNYDKLNKRNNKKDNAHLNKHAMHLIRLYLMCIDILEKETVITFRENEHDLLMSIRHGEFQKPDGTFRSEFFDMVTELECRAKYAAEHTALPSKPNYKKIEELVIYMNEEAINIDRH